MISYSHINIAYILKVLIVCEGKTLATITKTSGAIPCLTQFEDEMFYADVNGAIRTSQITYDPANMTSVSILIHYITICIRFDIKILIAWLTFWSLGSHVMGPYKKCE